MIIVSDTSPICYLVLIEQIELLPRLFGEIAIPSAVDQELRSTKAPAPPRKWIENIPDWLIVHSIEPLEDERLHRLHLGEREAIALARRLNADLILIDERSARKVAQNLGLNVTGLLGIIETAAKRDLIDTKTVLERLQQTNFRISPRLIQDTIERYQPDENDR